MCVAIAALGLTAAATASIASTAVTAGLTVASLAQQQKQKNNEAKASNDAAARAFAIEKQAQGLAADEKAAAVATSAFQNKQEASRAQGGALAAAGSSGVQGGALDAVLNDFSRQQGQANSSLGQTLRFAGQSATIQQSSSFERTVSNSALNNRKGKLNALQVGGAVLGGVNTGLSLRQQFKTDDGTT